MNNTNSPHTSQLIHAAVELVVGACITFWLNRKISTVSQKVGVLEDKLKFYENMLGQHHELIKKLFTIIERISSGGKITKSPLESFKPPESSTHTLLEPPVASHEAVTITATDTSDTTDTTDVMDTTDTMAALDAILSNEINDIKIDRTASLT